ncbi:hypothetical protein ACNJYA_30655 [Bradyrhizobium sp. DASA03068]|uniref:hypothetical protein n=1 Tax=Bradyrhizobium sp. BLXBL-01 TaxID=3395915 RepID=UPI003F71FC38
MSYQATVFNVMIASPSDVDIERGLAREIIHEWNAVNSSTRSIALMPIGWETHSHPSMEDRPQGVLNKQILDDADLLVAIFWTRIGTPTGEAVSGSVEEIERHVNAGKPAMIYFSSAPVRAESVVDAQYKALLEFKAKLKDRGLYVPYESTGDFAAKFRNQLALKINNDIFFHVEGVGADRTAFVDQTLTEAFEKVPPMTDEARTLLLEAASDPGGQILHMKLMDGERIQTNGKQFIADNSARTAAIWGGALNELVDLGLVQGTGLRHQIYKVTREGYEMAEAIKS